MDLRFLGLSPTLAELTCGAMYALALADGSLDETEERLLNACVELMGLDPSALKGVSAEEIAAQVEDPEERRSILRAMILMSLMDGQVLPEETAVIEHYAFVLAVDERRIKNLRQIIDQRHRLLFFDLARRSFARDIFVKELRQKGPSGVWKIVGPMLGRALDPKLASRYRACETLPAESLGRAYWQFMTDYQLPFPGESYAVPESGVWHDMSHVLGGYSTDPADEVLVVAFIAGYTRSDPFFWLFTIALQFHLGINVSPYSPIRTGLFEPARVLEAVKRGSQVKLDLSKWDWWPHMASPLDQVRSELGVEVR